MAEQADMATDQKVMKEKTFYYGKLPRKIKIDKISQCTIRDYLMDLFRNRFLQHSDQELREARISYSRLIDTLTAQVAIELK